MKPESTINIFFTADNHYAKYLAVTITSIIVNTEAFVSFYVLDGGISKESKRRIEDLKRIKPFQIEYILIDNKRFDNAPKSSQKHISNNTNYRFLISTLKPSIDRCIFLDADLVANGDISELWNVDIGDNYMAAVSDQFPLCPNSWAQKLPLPKDYIYVNTGVIVVNLKKWREDGIEEKLFENLERYCNLLMFPDQDTLNITLAPYVRYLPHVFNAMPVQCYYNIDQAREAFSAPVILHWAGARKPWRKPHVKMANIYFHYARMTPFYEEILYENVINDEVILSNVKSEELREIVSLPDYRRKLARICFKVHFSWGKRKQRYLKRKEQLRNKIDNIGKILKNM